MMKTLSSRSISSRKASEIAWRMVISAMVMLLAGIHVVEARVQPGLGAALGEDHGFLDFFLHGLFHLGQVCLASKLLLDQIAIVNADWVGLLPFSDFVLLAIALRVTHRMALK